VFFTSYSSAAYVRMLRDSLAPFAAAVTNVHLLARHCLLCSPLLLTQQNLGKQVRVCLTAIHAFHLSTAASDAVYDLKLQNSSGKITQRRGYLGRPSLPSKVCTHTDDELNTFFAHEEHDLLHDTASHFLDTCEGHHLSEPLVLLDGPWHHLTGAGRCEEKRRQRLRAHGKAQPRADLRRVVGTRDVVEQEAPRDDVLLGPRGPQAGLNQVAPAHTQLDINT
jgi:hypothetical protein